MEHLAAKEPDISHKSWDQTQNYEGINTVLTLIKGAEAWLEMNDNDDS